MSLKIDKETWELLEKTVNSVLGVLEDGKISFLEIPIILSTLIDLFRIIQKIINK